MLQSLREEREGKLQMLLSLRKNGLDSLFKEVRVFKASEIQVRALGTCLLGTLQSKFKKQGRTGHDRNTH